MTDIQLVWEPSETLYSAVTAKITYRQYNQLYLFAESHPAALELTAAGFEYKYKDDWFEAELVTNKHSNYYIVTTYEDLVDKIEEVVSK